MARNVRYSEEDDKLTRTLKKVRRFLADASHIFRSTRQTRRTDERKNFKRFQLIPKSTHKFSRSNSKNIMMAAHHLADYSRAIIITADCETSPIRLFKVVPVKYIGRRVPKAGNSSRRIIRHFSFVSRNFLFVSV